MAFEKAQWSQAPVPGAESEPLRPEWQGLRARMFAARQARQALQSVAAQEPAVASGSFDEATAALLSGYDAESGLVNRNSSTDLNPERDIYSDVAETSSHGARG